MIKSLFLLLFALPVFAADVELYVQPMHIEDDDNVKNCGRQANLLRFLCFPHQRGLLAAP